MINIFPGWRRFPKGNLKRARPARRALAVETLESRLTPVVDNFFNPLGVIAVNPQPLPPMPTVQLSMNETVTPPAPSPTSAPPTESMTFGIAANGPFSPVSVNPQPLPP